MKNRVNVAYFFAIALCVFGLAATFQRVCSKICAIRYISYSFDPQLSITMRSAIEQQVSRLECDAKYQVPVIMQELLRIFPDIKQIDVRSLPYNMAEVVITAPDPVVRINNSHVLTENQSIISSNYYAQYALDRLPEMRVSSKINRSVSLEMMAAIQQSIKEQIFDRFMVSLCDEQKWYLQDKKDPLFTICCNASSLPTGTLCALYDQVKQEVRKKGMTKTAWTADIRFNHQIVLSRYKGGRYGKRI